MGTSSLIATNLDIEMFALRRLKIDSARTPDGQLDTDDAAHFAKAVPRLLLRYVRSHQIGALSGGTTTPQYVTVTPYAGDEAVSWLALPNPMDPPTHVLLLDPAQMAGHRLAGPRWVRLGNGIEFILLDGFPNHAVVKPGWEVEVR